MSKQRDRSLIVWLSAKPDCKDKRFIQVGNSLLLDKRFQKLHASAQLLYLCAAMESGKCRQFVFPLQAAKKYGIAENTMRRGFDELIQNGFVELRSSGKNVRQPNEYVFSFKWKEHHG